MDIINLIKIKFLFFLGKVEYKKFEMNQATLLLMNTNISYL